VRDPEERRYPYSEDIPDFDVNPRWRVMRFTGFRRRGLGFVGKTFFAYLDDDGEHWDAAFAWNQGKLRSFDDPWGAEEDAPSRELEHEIRGIWDGFPEKNRAWYELVAVLPYEDIIEIDEIGDSLVEDPHIFATFRRGLPFNGFFAKVSHMSNRGRGRSVDLSDTGRIEKFLAKYREGPDRPKPLK
jgi:hypothetical protein